MPASSEEAILERGQLFDGHLRWTLEHHRHCSVSTVGRFDRQALGIRQINLAVPDDLIAEIAEMTFGGGTQAGYLALLVFAVETLKKQRLHLRMSVSGTEVASE